MLFSRILYITRLDRSLRKLSLIQIITIFVLLLFLTKFISQPQSEPQQPPINELPVPKHILNRVKYFTQCVDTSFGHTVRQRWEYWVVYDYLPALFTFKCHESVTLATHGEFYSLENLVLLAERWRGPISVAVYASGNDFEFVMEAILYLRRCSTELVKNYVSFHVYFRRDVMPGIEVPLLHELLLQDFNCNIAPLFRQKEVQNTFRFAKKLPYPINVARNIAREFAKTYFVLSSDIELFPSLNLIPNFLWMISRNRRKLHKRELPLVFTLPVFEVGANETLPDNKTELVEKIKNGTAVRFQRKACRYCYWFPLENKWVRANASRDLNVFTIGKRTGRFRFWEPVYIGTQSEPEFDDWLMWEGGKDKLFQAYKLCVLDYDFMVLDNAFLVHQSGMKPKPKHPLADEITIKNTVYIKKYLFPAISRIFGYRNDCFVYTFLNLKVSNISR